MQDLIKQEQFELEVLSHLNSKKLLNNLLFIGGTMLRLCCGLNRYSVGLDFWVKDRLDTKTLYKNLQDCLVQKYVIKDKADKQNTLLFEIRSNDYPRSLKIEIRKEAKALKSEQVIAYSKYSNLQVMVKTIPLEHVMQSKLEAFLSRKEIRDVFDLEFLIKRGIELNAPKDKLEALLKGIEGFSVKDYSVKLGSLLEADQRKYYKTSNFNILKMAIKEKLSAG